ncbi:hypothetical protein HYFRA_00005105 [Hymenoscyphus fraxineus]|uniref:Uncharacterized protein n=1 Tax=Hymenoscyphus fraxineus TaxID=746836 RepID=A0A9N9Q1S8_9HELO|nr:hypothetical protein HYFRA_00005105 [Hymenoscyphus fraxineus]
MKNPLKFLKQKRLSFLRRRERLNSTTTQPPQSPTEDTTEILSLTTPSTPIPGQNLASSHPQSQATQSPPLSSSPVSPNRLVALPQSDEENRTWTTTGTNTSAHPTPHIHHSPLSTIRRTLSTTGGTIKRTLSTSNPKAKDSRVSIKGLTRSSTASYSKLGGMSEGPEEDLGFWICCQDEDDVSPWPCRKQNDLAVSVCERCGHWNCERCVVERKKGDAFGRGEGMDASSFGGF